MANKSVRIQTTAGSTDKYVTVKLENEVDFYEILSLKISQKDIYGTFNSDYGVIVGRVIANGGVGIPNAKISVFIPISDEDKTNSDIATIYPYTTPRDKDLDGIRYNLLPRVAVSNPFLVVGEYSPKVPVGTFPTKEEITTNDNFLEVYKKYYKFTTVSNQSGDYMIFGVPIGVQTVHMSVDITDIGKYSMTPGTMITQLGYSPNLFDENGTRIKPSTDLETLPNIETQEVAVNVRPFWGDQTTFEIGITRQDFKIRATLINTFVVFGSAFTDAQSATWGRGGSDIKQLYAMYDSPSEISNLSIATKRIGLLNEKIFFIPTSVSDAEIAGGTFDPKTDYKILDQTQYSRFVENGQFVYIIACNRRKIITDEFGNEVVVDNDNNAGVFTRFNGFMLLDYSDKQVLPIDRVSQYQGRTPDPDRFRFKIPQDAAFGTSVPYPDDTTHLSQNNTWRRQNAEFAGGNFYSVARFNGISNSDNSSSEGGINTRTTEYSSGAIVTNDNGSTAIYQFPTNGNDTINPSNALFAAEWINFCLYFPQYTRYNSALDAGNAGRSRLLNADNRNLFESTDNNQLIASTELNTKHLGRADLNKTAFVLVPKEDILNIINNAPTLKGFKSTTPPFNSNPLIGSYLGTGGTKYFYRGYGISDCVEYLVKLGLIII